MVGGIKLFAEYFEEFSDSYILIGGAACALTMSDSGVPFRATKDLDIILCVEVLSMEFVQRFWSFIKDGEYEIQQRSDGTPILYRFQKPTNKDFPVMIELFSRTPDALDFFPEISFTTIPTDDAVSSLSAILLDNDYYEWIHDGKSMINGIHVLKLEYLIGLKAQAWLNLTSDKNVGKNVSSSNINKHKNDILRLFQIIDTEEIIYTPQSIINDINGFWDGIADESIDLKNLGLERTTLTAIRDSVLQIYIKPE